MYTLHIIMECIKYSYNLCLPPTVFTRIVAAATINFAFSSVRLLIEGGSYSRADTINFV